jgi:hypothetical protein
MWEVKKPLDYSATGDDIDSASLKIIETFADVYEKLNRLRQFDASIDHAAGDAVPFSMKIDTSLNPPAIMMRNADNTDYIPVGSVAKGFGLNAADIGAIHGEGFGSLYLGLESALPSTAQTGDLYIAYDTSRVYVWRSGAWRIFLSLHFHDMMDYDDEGVVTKDEVATSGPNKIVRLNNDGVGEFSINGSANKWAGKAQNINDIQDGQVLVWSASEKAFVNANQGGIGNARMLVIRQNDSPIAQYNGSEHVDVNIDIPDIPDIPVIVVSKNVPDNATIWIEPKEGD